MWGYLDRVGFQIDCLLCALFGGPEDTPISLAAARARLAEQRRGRFGWACVLCRWLSLTVERHHCTKQIEGRPVIRWGALLAGFQLAVLFGLLFYGVPFLVGRLW